MQRTWRFAQATSRCFSNKSLLRNSKQVQIDTTNLIQKSYTLQQATNDNSNCKEPETSMIKYLKDRIKGSGPLSVATFMNECLLNPKHGYYATKQHIFGKSGDFITSPEISSLFGELVGLWCFSMWQQMGKPKRVKLMELGPGRGTLMHDMVRMMSGQMLQQDAQHMEEVKQFVSCITGIHLVEASPVLRQVQAVTLSGKKESNDARTILGNIPLFWHDKWEDAFPKELQQIEVAGKQQQHHRLVYDEPVLVVAHEFFDALPVYQFEYTTKGWLEVMIDIEESSQVEEHFKFVLAPAKTLASTFLSLIDAPKQIAQRVEVCPLGIGIMQQISEAIALAKGGALIVDYGYDSSKHRGITLQGILDHQFCSPLKSPGNVDLSTFVDFAALKRGLHKKEQVFAHGAQSQGDFLTQMGIDARLVQVLKNASLTNEQVEKITQSYLRLIDANQMGQSYKVLAVTSEKEPAPAFDIVRQVVDPIKLVKL